MASHRSHSIDSYYASAPFKAISQIYLCNIVEFANVLAADRELIAREINNLCIAIRIYEASSTRVHQYLLSIKTPRMDAHRDHNFIWIVFNDDFDSLRFDSILLIIYTCELWNFIMHLNNSVNISSEKYFYQNIWIVLYKEINVQERLALNLILWNF